MKSLEFTRLLFFTLLVISYVLNLFLKSNNVTYLIGLLAIVSIIISIKGATRLVKIFSAIFISMSLFLFKMTDLTIVEIPMHMNSTVMIIVLLYVLPFINNIFKVGRYDRTINQLLKLHISNLGQMYYRVSLASYILSLFLFFAALPLVYETYKNNLKHLSIKIKNQFSSKVIVRGFSMAMVWSPIEVLVAISVELTQVSYLRVLPWLMLLSIIYLAMDWVWGYFLFKKHDLPHQENVKVSLYPIIKKIASILLILLLFIFVVTLVNQILHISFLMAVALTIIPFSLVWSLLISKPRLYIRYSWLNWKKGTPSLNHVILMFLPLGFFNAMITNSSVIDKIQQPFIALSEMALLLFIVIHLTCLILSLIGIHPLVTLSLFGMMIHPLLEVINPISLTIVLITATLSTASVGTFNTTVIIMSSLQQINPFQISKTNFVFGLLYGAMGTTLAWILL